MILFPIKKGTISQPFGANPDFYNKNYGIKGHQGTDIVSFHGDGILCPEDGFVYKTFDINNGSISKGFGLHIISLPDENNGCREHIIWHTQSNLQAKKGDKVFQGDCLAYEGDSGDVYVNNIKVPDSLKGVIPFPGTHLHWGVRNLIRTKNPITGTQVLSNSDDMTPYIDSDGYQYQVINFSNGYRGGIDPMSLNISYYQDWIDSKITPILKEVPKLPEEEQITILQSIINLLKVAINRLFN